MTVKDAGMSLHRCTSTFHRFVRVFSIDICTYTLPLWLQVEGFDGEDQRPRKRRLLSAVVKVRDVLTLVTEVSSFGTYTEHSGNVL